MRFVDVLSYFSILSSGEKLIICYFVPHHFQESDNGKLELVNRNVMRSRKHLHEAPRIILIAYINTRWPLR